MKQKQAATKNVSETWTSFTRSRFDGAVFSNSLPSVQLSHSELEISAIEQSLALAKELRNKSVPINVLPPETLTEIFLFVRDEFIDEPLSWLRACTHTCRRFRSVALSSCALWTHVSNMGCSSKLAKTFIARSGAYPTNLKLCLTGISSSHTMHRIAMDFEFNRVEDLHIVVVGGCKVQLFDMEAPLLKSLSISIYAMGSGLLTDPICVPRAIESLHLKCDVFTLNSGMYDNLVHLSLENVQSSALSLEDLQHLFRRMRHVTSITIANSGFRNSLTADSSSVQLPESLKHLALLQYSELESVFTVFNPRSSLKRLTLTPHDGVVARVHTLLSNTFQHWCRMWNSDAHVSMEVSYEFDTAKDLSEFKVTLRSISPSADSSSPSTPEPQTITYSRSLCPGFRLDKGLAEILPTAIGLRLAVYSYRKKKAEDEIWHSFFSMLEELQTLILVECSLSTFLPHMVKNPTWFPQLEALEVTEDTDEKVCKAEGFESMGHVHVVWLSQWLAGRKAAGLSEPEVRLPSVMREWFDQTLDSSAGKHV